MHLAAEHGLGGQGMALWFLVAGEKLSGGKYHAVYHVCNNSDEHSSAASNAGLLHL